MLNYRINTFAGIIIILVFMGTVYFLFQDRINPLFSNSRPCDKTIEYSIASLDPRFKISTSTLITITEKAQNVWSSSVGKKLFEYSPDGDLKISLIYDQRQEVTDSLENIGDVLDKNKSSYEELKAKRVTLSQSYMDEKSKIDALIRNYKVEDAQYKQLLAQWNNQSSHTREQADYIEQKRLSVNNYIMRIKNQEVVVNQISSSINSITASMNNLAEKTNRQISNYNHIGASVDEVFDEGKYTYDSEGARIDIYQFADTDQLFRVLMHEFGHALGLEHVSSPNAIMYYLNEDGNDNLTEDDIAELNRVCTI
jgi:predicted Zn-dependent protease